MLFALAAACGLTAIGLLVSKMLVPGIIALVLMVVFGALHKGK